ncbi:MAG: hypothetical protein JSV04_03855, partial [Candidatus Heimdallarchaeota archaeon]
HEKESQLSKLDQIEEELKSLNAQLGINKEKYRKLTKKIEQLEKEEEEKRVIHEQFQNLQSKAKDAQNRLEGKKQSLKKLQSEMQNYSELRKKLQKTEKEIEAMRELEEEIKSLESIKKEHKLMEKHLKTLEKKRKDVEHTLKTDLKSKQKKIKKEEEKIKNLDTTVDHITAFKILNQEGRLLERVQRISKEKTWKLPKELFEEIHEEQVEARENLKELTKRKEKISKDSFVLSEKRERIFEIKTEIDTLNERLKSEMDISEREIQTEEKKITQLGFNSTKQQHLDTIRVKFGTFEEIEANYRKLKLKIEEISDPKGEIKSINTEIKEINVELKKFHDKLKGYPTFKSEYEKLINVLDERRKEERISNDIIVRTDQKIKDITQKINELKQLKPEIEEIKTNLQVLIKEEDILQKLKTEVFHTTGAPFYAITKILPRLGKRASLILSDLTNQRFSHIQLQKVEKGKMGMGFEILLKVPDGLRDVATFSGGERTQINAALRLAISEEISSLGQPSGMIEKKTLFIDEGDLGSLDTLEAQAAFVKKLFSLSTQFKIILVTHIQEIADQFPHSINIALDSYGRSVSDESA